MSVMVNRIGGLSASSAASNWMSAANSLTNLSFAGNQNPASLMTADKQLQYDMFNDSLAYQSRLQQQENLQKLTDANIKRTFSVFA